MLRLSVTPRESAMKYLWKEFDNFKKSLSFKKPKLVLLDFDGTLAPIVPTPNMARLSQETRQILTAFNKFPHHHLAIISGRSLKELSSLIRLQNVIYAGNHGLEMKGRNLYLPPRAKKARRLKRLIGFLATKFKTAFESYEGVLVEDKSFTLSLHFRTLLPDQSLLFNELVRFFREKYEKYPVTWTKGKKVWEIRPRYYWDKGDTVLYLIRKFPGALPIVIGDDLSDEDMFKVIKRRGITIRVGRLKGSQADYYLKSPNDVKMFLKKLCH